MRSLPALHPKSELFAGKYRGAPWGDDETMTTPFIWDTPEEPSLPDRRPNARMEMRKSHAVMASEDPHMERALPEGRAETRKSFRLLEGSLSWRIWGSAALRGIRHAAGKRSPQFPALCNASTWDSVPLLALREGGFCHAVLITTIPRPPSDFYR